jgi:RNA ligase (TIGR02306 family)
MATFEVTIEKIEIFPHPNADKLELARVGLYNVVVGKGQFQSGDSVLYVPEYAVLPEPIITALGLTGKLAGSNNDRVKPIKLRGELSQGLVISLDALPNGIVDGVHDYAEILDISKYEPQIPVHMAGDIKGSTELTNWIDIENIKKYPDLFTDGTEVHISEKIHGTASLFTFLFKGDQYHYADKDVDTFVSSKGLGAKKFIIKEDDKNLYWRALRTYQLDKLARIIATDASLKFAGPDNEFTIDGVDYVEPMRATIEKVALFGETFGAGVQDLHYGFINKLGFAVFDAYVEFYGGSGYWVNPVDLEMYAEQANVPTVPTLYVGPYSLDVVIEHAYGKETISGKNLHVREGVVVRPTHRVEGYWDGAKQIAKYVSDDYLLRKGETTEYS